MKVNCACCNRECPPWTKYCMDGPWEVMITTNHNWEPPNPCEGCGVINGQWQLTNYFSESGQDCYWNSHAMPGNFEDPDYYEGFPGAVCTEGPAAVNTKFRFISRAEVIEGEPCKFQLTLFLELLYDPAPLPPFIIWLNYSTWTATVDTRDDEWILNLDDPPGYSEGLICDWAPTVRIRKTP